MEDLPVIGPYIGITGWLAVVALVMVSTIRGWLVPGTQVQRVIDAYERVIEDKQKQIDNWQEAFRNSDARGDILADNQRVLIESIRTTNNLIQGLAYRPAPEKETSK